MIFIDTNGGKKKQRELVSQVAYWCISRLMPRLKKIEIDIQLNNLKDGAVGYCIINDNNDGQDYYNLSYEKQAYELQETLSEQFIKECDYEMA